VCSDAPALGGIYFRNSTYPDPEHVYYLNPDHFPTAEQLADPEYVQAQFPKPLLDAPQPMDT